MTEFIDTFLKKAAAAVDDAATLDVITLTGDIKVETGDKTLELGKLYENLVNAVKAAGTGAGATASVTMVAFTHVEADMDAVLFVKDNLTASQSTLLASHTAMVSAAQQARTNFIKAAAALVKGVL